ncbi:MAG: hypothetical protein RIG27_05095 [Coleofasciculus sp. F4-SAH-05]
MHKANAILSWFYYRQSTLCLSKVKFLDVNPVNLVFQSFVIRHLSFVICHSSFVIRHLSFVICHSSFVIRHLSFVICHLSFASPSPSSPPSPPSPSSPPSLPVPCSLKLNR